MVLSRHYNYGTKCLNLIKSMTQRKKKVKIKCETCKGKSFCNWSANRFHFNFPNGNHISVVWGCGTYTENYDCTIKEYLRDRETFSNSDDIEIMFDCSEKRKKEIFKKMKTDSQPLGHIDMEKFVWLFNRLSK